MLITLNSVEKAGGAAQKLWKLGRQIDFVVSDFTPYRKLSNLLPAVFNRPENSQE